MRKRIISNISLNLKNFAKDYFFFQIAVACSAFIVGIMLFILKPDVKNCIIAGVCCLAGSLVYVAKAYMSLLLFHGLGELIDTNKQILKELGVKEPEEEEKKKEVKLDNVYDTIEYNTDARIKRNGKIFIRERFVSISSKHVSFKDITAFNKGNEIIENYGFEDVNSTVYHIKTQNENYYFSFVDPVEEKMFRKELHEKLTKSSSTKKKDTSKTTEKESENKD